MARHFKLSTLRSFALAVFATGMCSGTAGLAQNTELRPRIPVAIDNTQRVALAGTHPHQAIAADDAGAVPPDTHLRGMSLAFSRTVAQQTSLDRLAAAQQNPASPLYHRWLTTAQFAAHYGAADADIAAVATWLESKGFSVDSVSHSRGRISFSGSAVSVANAFDARLHYYQAASETARHFAPSTDISIPAALASAVLTVSNLSNYRPLPQIIVRSPRQVPQDNFTALSGNVFLDPPTVAGIYDVQSVYQRGYDGTGQTIAIVGQSAVLPQDLANFQTANGLAVEPQSLNLIPGTGASTIVAGDEMESDLDLEFASAMAPGASVAFYYTGPDGGGVYQALEYVIDNNLARIISVSYATCEMPGLGSYIESIDALLEQGAVQGQTVVVASGDDGSTACMAFMVPEAVGHAPLVDYPASSPWVVALGGTEFPAADLTNDPINQTYWAPPVGDSVHAIPLGYIPETVWNDAQGMWAGGGGASVYEPLPLWQTGVPGIPGGTQRLVPDISLAASPIYPGYFIYSTNADGKSLPLQIGGTSAAAPVFAGLLAVLNQVKGYTVGQGLINPTLYLLASNPATYATAFHDVTVGDNTCTNVACDVGVQNTVYLAGVGYDEASGLGSIDFAKLVAAWPEATDNSAVTTTTALAISSLTPVYGDNRRESPRVRQGQQLWRGNAEPFHAHLSLQRQLFGLRYLRRSKRILSLDLNHRALHRHGNAKRYGLDCLAGCHHLRLRRESDCYSLQRRCWRYDRRLCELHRRPDHSR
ncbi:MAG: S53 family serine peptidase [Acidobacteriota bacterium]|nr:S53 family serine peptidase [Acidobacteriota bacterium]